MYGILRALLPEIRKVFLHLLASLLNYFVFVFIIEILLLYRSLYFQSNIKVPSMGYISIHIKNHLTYLHPVVATAKYM